ncbi:MAG: hypothetical protein ACPGQS_10700, partial [Bradymonadia bacterium]
MKVNLAITHNSAHRISGLCGTWAVFLIWLSAVATTGCSSKQCLFESDCAQGLVCAESVCRQGCDEERQCPVDFSC